MNTSARFTVEMLRVLRPSRQDVKRASSLRAELRFYPLSCLLVFLSLAHWSWYPENRGESAMNVKLDPKDERDLEALAREGGKDPGELLRELLHEALLHRKENGAGAAAESGEENCYDAALRVGLIGAIKGGPPDLSTNPKYMEGFGED
jgi:hypothetical protein